MALMTMKMTGDPNAVMGQILDRFSAFLADVQEAEKDAAATATKVTQTSFKRLRPLGEPRAGRPSRGQMARSARWRPLKGGRVGFNYAGMNQDQPHWIIQEIGTGKKAVIRSGGTPRPVGRPTKGATYVRTVKAQRGRRLPGSLVWSANGRYVPPSRSVRNQQIALRRRVTGYPATGSPASIRIRREIKGQHFVQRGGQEGFREYRASVLAAARQQLKRRG